MNDRNLYRAKHIHALSANKHLDGTWIEGYLCNENYINSPSLEGEFLIDPSTICQCTGLKDKVGKLIWENDILMCHGNPKDLCKVCFGEFKVIDVENMVAIDIVQGWYYKPLETDALSKCEPFCYEMPLTNYYLERMDAEVIGNIFDNQELLEKNKCKTCQCSRCDNDTCDWCRCEKNEPKEECFQSDCRDYGNEQEDIEEGFLDGYE